MAWMETCAMDERGLFVAEAMRAELGFAALCRRYGVSRKTGYKWLGRYNEEGFAGLADRSHAAHGCPHALDAAIAARILAVRRAHPSWGPRKVKAWLGERLPRQLWPAASTIGDLFKREGLTVARRKRSRAPANAPLSHALGANDVWSIDFKGWFRTGDGKRCDPLTVQDAASRYLIRCQVLERTDWRAVWPLLEAAFYEYGLPKALRSDNGAPFASVGAGGLSPLSLRVVKAGIGLERIEPGKPQQNGRHERFHLTLLETVAPPKANRRAQQRAFDDFCRLYNEERPHEALGQKPPARFYMASPRRYSGRLREPDYDDDIAVRRVRDNGEIKWRGGLLYVSRTLAGEPVAIEEGADGHCRVRYGPIDLGVIDRRGRLQQQARATPGAAPRSAAPGVATPLAPPR